MTVAEGAATLEHQSDAGETRTELSRIVARDFRNLRTVDVTVPPEGVVLLGENGQGKTNFLEVIRYFTIMRSARGAADADLVAHGEETFFISAHALSPCERQVQVGYSRAAKQKKVSVDGVVAGRLSDAFGGITATLMSPGDAQLVAGGPAERRRYLDVLLSLVDPRYLVALQRYRGALVRRNTVLREAAKRSADDAQIAAWEPLLAESGALLWQWRLEWCERAAADFTRICNLMGENGTASIELEMHGPSNGTEQEELLHALESHRAGDIRRGGTGVGPHRDDLRILLNGHDLRAFGSGGQQHTAALALRFLETFTLKERQKRWPVLLLDDPFAELDARRAERILRLVEDSGHGQVILAVPREDNVPREFTRLERWRVEGGAISTKGT